jgi:RNA polymerase sigma factor (sigma-70 family)
LLNDHLLDLHIKGCMLNKRDSQKELYTAYYPYGRAVCERYATSPEDCAEILNDAFLKMFKQIHRFNPTCSDLQASYKGWLKKIIVCTAIDHFRKHALRKSHVHDDKGFAHLAAEEEDVHDKISRDEIMHAMQELTPAYKAVLHLFAIEGWSHEAIAEKLSISIGTSKSNLFKARKQLHKIMLWRHEKTNIRFAV